MLRRFLPGFPQRFAAASLKHPDIRAISPVPFPFSAAFCCGLIEALSARLQATPHFSMFSAAFCCGLIEAQNYFSV